MKLFLKRNLVWTYSIWINAIYNSIKDEYVWVSNGEPITQFPHSYSYVNAHSTFWERTTPLWLLSIPNSNSYLNSGSSNALANSILCLNRDLLKRPTNPCSNSDQVNNTFWFGTFIHCKRDVYSLSFAKDHCPVGQVLGEIMDASLYTNITQELSIRTQ